MVMSKPLATRSVPLWRVETAEELIASVISSGKTVTISGGAMVQNRYQNQIALVLTGTLKGTYLHVVSNTTGVLTFEETVGTSIAVNDRIAVSTWGQPPQDAAGGITDLFGQMLDQSLPMLVRTHFEGRYHGSSSMPAIEELISMSNEYASDIPLVVKNAMVLAMAFGVIEENTVDYDGADPDQAITVHVYPGAKTIEIGDSSGFTTGDIVHITGGTSGLAEVNKVASKSTGKLVMTWPCKNQHDATSGHVHKVKATDGVPDTTITHTMTVGFELPTFTYESSIKRETRWSGQDIVLQFLGLIMTKLELASSPGNEPLKANISVTGLHYRSKTAAGASLTAGSVKASVGFDKGTYMPCKCTVIVNGTTYNEAAEFTAVIERPIESPRFHNGGGIPYMRCGDPIEHIEQAPNITVDITIPFRNKNLIDLLEADTEFTVSKQYVRDATNDEMTITITGCKIKGPLIGSIPESGQIPQQANCIGRNMSIVVKDFIPCYMM